MTSKILRRVWRLDAEGRLSPQANARDWRVVAADRDRIDTAIEYLFCPPDFLFPVDGVARALRLAVDPRPSAPVKLRPRARSTWGDAMAS